MYDYHNWLLMRELMLASIPGLFILAVAMAEGWRRRKSKRIASELGRRDHHRPAPRGSLQNAAVMK